MADGSIPSQDDAALSALKNASTWAAIEQVLPHVSTRITAEANAGRPETVDALCTALVANVFRLMTQATRGQGQIFVPAALAIPVLLARIGWQPHPSMGLSQLRATCGKLFEAARSYQVSVALLWALLVLNGIAVGPRRALASFVTAAASRSNVLNGETWTNDCAIVGRSLCQYGWFARDADDAAMTALEDALRGASAKIVKQDHRTCASLVTSYLGFLSFEASTAPPEWLDTVFDAFIVPTTRAICGDPKHFELALTLDYKFNSVYVRAVEGSERFLNLHRTWVPLMEQAGAQVKRSRAWPSSDGPPRVAFLLHSPQRLAHTDLMLACLRGFAGSSSRSIDCSVVMLSPQSELTQDLEARLADLSVPLHCVDQTQSRDVASIMTWLGTYVQERGVTALVFVSATTFLVLAAAMRLAPVVVWWSMKYHGMRSAYIDGYLTSPSIFQDRLILDGQPWRASHAALPPMTKPGAEAAGREARAALGLPAHAVVLGCFGREAKLLDPRFAEALAQVLHASPGACFIWAGRSQPPELVARFAALGIEKRCSFVGWVDTKVYAHVIDIYLDSFPFASGHTAYEAMATAKPIVVLLTPEAMETSTATSIMPLFRGERGPPEVQREVRQIFSRTDNVSLLPFLETVDAYVAYAQRLVTDPDFRRAAGAAGKAFVDRFMFDYERFAETTSQHLIEIIAEKRAASEIRA